MKKLIDIINDEKADKETISTGFRRLDRLIHGFKKSDLVYIGARPAMGKTTFAVNLAENIARSGKKCAFFSLELSDEMLAKKFSTANSDMEIYIDDTPGITVSEMNQKIKNLKNVDCVVIDYFGLIRPEIKRMDKMQECHDISRKLRKMANELNIPIICTTTVARSENYGERPRFSDLLDGGRLEFYADIFMFLHRNSYYFCEINEDDIEDHTTELIIAKNKHGSTGVINLKYNSETKEFTEEFKLLNKERVELHLHTSFSEMDGINSLVDYINRAAEWGHKAIAITDHGVVQGLPEAYKAAKDAGIKLILGMEGYLVDDEKYPDFMNMKLRDFKRHHVIILIKEDTSFDEDIPKESRVYGRRNLYELISYSHTKTYKSRPLIPKSLLAQKRQGLLIGSACEQGELYQAVLCNESQEEIERIASFYDYLEIQPNCNNDFMINSKSEFHKSIHNEKDLIQINKRIIEIADKLKKPVVATDDAHFLDKEDAECRAVLMHVQGFDDAEVQPDLHFKSTDEMLDEFAWAGNRAKEFVVDNPNKIADMIMDDIRPVPNEYFPFAMEKANEELKEICEKRVRELYGDNPPSQIRARLDKELELLMNFNFSTYYVLAMKIVEDSKKHGYTVGARGSVGASFVAYLCGITNINPLEPHYYCPDCHYTEFITDDSVASGFDLSEKKCPHCNAPLKRDGHEIPYETFLGFDGDKEPDIDLNLSSEYQESAHKFIYKLFGENRVFYAGTIATVADKTAHRYVMEYLEKQGIKDSVSDDEIERLVSGCTGVKRTTGVHPGGVLVLPKGCVIEDFTPVQYFCNDPSTEKLKTHFSYRNSDLDFHLTKFDLLGHDVPTMLKHLEELTGVKAEDIDISAPELYELLTSCKPLGVNPEDIKCETGTLAINELGTEFMTNLLMLTKPKNFSELVKVSGLSHGTNTWKNNAENFVESNSFDFKTVPACRDDVFVYLLHKCKEYENKTGRKSPLSKLDCFKIMEFTRKGKADRFLAELEDKMQAISVDYSYIRSLKKIRYMFPKAHAVSYVIWALQLLWYKLYYPQEFYNVYFKFCYNELYSSIVNKSINEIWQLFKEPSDYHNQYKAVLEMLERGCCLE